MGQFYLFIALILFLSQSSVLNAQLCNGYSELCGRSYAAIAYPGTHNSFSYSPIPLPAENQFQPIDKQLQAGIRSFMLDGHNPPPHSENPDGIHLCHTSCALLNAGDSVKTLTLIANFLKNNPGEVITIIWENFDSLPSSKYQAAYQAAGLDVLSYVQPDGQQQWPTLQELIDMNKRCISFIDHIDALDVPWLLPQWTYMIDTPYNATDPSGWKCVVDRPAGGTVDNIALININNFLNKELAPGLDVPHPVGASQTNGPLLQQHLDQCTTAFGRIPNFISVDFASKGDLYAIVAKLNGLQPTTKRTVRRRHHL